jgi:hypothetical protein
MATIVDRLAVAIDDDATRDPVCRLEGSDRRVGNLCHRLSHHLQRLEQPGGQVLLEAASIDTRDATRDEHLRSTDFLDVEFAGASVDPWGSLRSGFDASTRIDRDQFGITWNQVLEAGGFLVGKEILVEINVEAIHQKDG